MRELWCWHDAAWAAVTQIKRAQSVFQGVAQANDSAFHVPAEQNDKSPVTLRDTWPPDRAWAARVLGEISFQAATHLARSVENPSLPGHGSVFPFTGATNVTEVLAGTKFPLGRRLSDGLKNLSTRHRNFSYVAISAPPNCGHVHFHFRVVEA